MSLHIVGSDFCFQFYLFSFVAESEHSKIAVDAIYPKGHIPFRRFYPSSPARRNEKKAHRPATLGFYPKKGKCFRFYVGNDRQRA